MPQQSLYHKAPGQWGVLPAPQCADLQTIWGALIGKTIAEDSNALRRIEMNRRLDNILAAKLEVGGIKCRQEVDSDILDYPLNGGTPIPVQRKGEIKNARWLIFFSTQAAVGRSVKRRLDLLQQQLGRKSRFIRMGVLSHGWLRLDELRSGITALHTLMRRVSKILEKYDSELLFHNIEAPLMRDEDGFVCVNLHTHFLRLDHSALGERVLQLNEELRAAAKKILDKEYFHDAGKIENFEELTKYMTKGDAAPEEDIDSENRKREGARKIGIEELTVSETVALHTALVRKNRFTPHGRARALWRLIDRGMPLESDESEDGQVSPSLIKMKIASLGKNKAGRRILVLTPRFARELAPEYAKATDQPRNIVLGTTIRAIADASGNNRLVGCLRVLAPSGSLQQIVDHRKLHKILEIHQRAFNANLALESAEGGAREAGPSMRHNNTVNFRVGVAAASETSAANPPPRMALVA